jgi:hypothetical protein
MLASASGAHSMQHSFRQPTCSHRLLAASRRLAAPALPTVDNIATAKDNFVSDIIVKEISTAPTTSKRLKEELQEDKSPAKKNMQGYIDLLACAVLLGECPPSSDCTLLAHDHFHLVCSQELTIRPSS